MAKEKELFEIDSQTAKVKKIAPKKKAGAKKIAPEKPIKAVKAKQPKALVKQSKVIVKQKPESEVSSLIRLALKEDVGLDKLERLIALKNQEEERAARKDFDFHFSQMQKELVPVPKSKDGSKTTGGTVIFKYAPIEKIQKLNNEIIARHGFSYKWREEKIGEVGEKRVRIIINGWGWTDTDTYFDIPKIATNNMTTEVQTRGAQSKYGERYTLIAGFGIVVEGEDDENRLTFDEGVDFAAFITRLKSSDSLKALMKNYQEITQELGGNRRGKEVIAIVKDDMKKVLSDGK